jgi:23S rRNA pseudouridine2605 synthase
MTEKTAKGERIAKWLARAGVASRREAERMIAAGRVRLDGKVIRSPALNISGDEEIRVDTRLVTTPEPTRLWRYHKPAGLLTTARDPEGRPTVFEKLPGNLPRVISVGRLDINTEGLLLLTNDGGLARQLELPATGWLRRYRVRAFGRIEQKALDTLKNGISLDGVRYGPVEAHFEKQQGGNCWLSLSLREGKNREIKKLLEHFGLKVNRLIRLSYGPFSLRELTVGEVKEVPRRVLRDQLGPEWAEKLAPDTKAAGGQRRPSRPGKTGKGPTKKSGKTPRGPHANRRRST